MAINELIARGIAPIGRDLPDVQNILAQRQEAQQRNALLNAQMGMRMEDRAIAMQDRRAAMLSAQDKARVQAKLAEMEQYRGNPQLEAQYVEAQKADPAFARTPFANLPPDQAFKQMYQGAVVAVTGKPYEQPQVPGAPTATNVGGFDVLMQDGRIVNSRAPRQPTPGGGAPAPVVTTLSPAEAEAAGFPKGAVVQRMPNGALKPVYRPAPTTAAADAKLRKEAATRLPQLSALDRRTERLSKAVEAISDNPIFSGGVVSEKVLPYTKEGRELNAAIAQVKPILTALTRVPGIGSQSDLEARLDSLQYPDAGFPAETNAANVEEIKAFIADLQSAYTNLLQGGAPASADDGWVVEDAEEAQ